MSSESDSCDRPVESVSEEEVEDEEDIPESSVDWQTRKETVRDRTAFLFNNSLMSDIKFVLTDSDGTQVRVPAHKLVLAISSPVFEAMFYGELAEKREEIDLPDTEPPFLLEFLRFLYCDEVRLTTDNAFGVLYLAQKYIVPSLADKCWEFIDNNTCACLKSDKAVSTLAHYMLSSLLQRETLQISKELELFNAVKFWAEAKCEQEDLEPTGEAVRKILGDAIYLIRFPTILPQDFVEQVVPSGILTDKESLDLHQYFYRHTSSDIKFLKTYRAGITTTVKLLECCCHSKDGNDQCTTGTAPMFGSPGATGFTFGAAASPLFRASTTAGVKLKLPKKKKICEKLDLMVEPRNVHLVGIHIITGNAGLSEGHNATLRLLSDEGNEIATETRPTENILTLLFGGDGPYKRVVTFKCPVLMWRSSKYTIEIESEVDADLKLNPDQANLVEVDDLYFIIKGTSQHIYKLLFYKLS